MNAPTSTADPWWRRSTWVPQPTALRSFVRTESSSALVLLAGIAAALLWANLAHGSYDAFWSSRFAIRVGRFGIEQDLRAWLDNGLMTFFFLVIGLETRREFDLGDLRERRRFVLPLAAGTAGMLVPVGIFLLINAGHGSAHGWGVAMSTDTALALGLLAVVNRGGPERLRLFVLIVFVVDDLAALVVIAVAYSGHISVVPLIVGVAAFGLVVAISRMRFRRPAPYVVLGVVMWLGLRAGGIDPITTGLAIGLVAPAYTPVRGELEAAITTVRSFREQPTPRLFRRARTELIGTLSPNDRLQDFYHRWTSFLIVPLFAVANAGIELRPHFLAHAYTTPVTLGVIVAYVAGKPLAVTVSSWATTRLTHGRIAPPVGPLAVLASGTIAGVGFTVSLLIADRAFHEPQLDEAKLGALSAAALAVVITALVLRGAALLPEQRRARALLGDPRLVQDLVPAVDSRRDHRRGPDSAEVTVIEFGDFECPFCGRAEPVVRELLLDTTIRYIWRHLPLTDVHPRAALAAEAAEAAAAQGAFWPMHDLLLQRQDRLAHDDLVAHAGELGLDVDRFAADLDSGAHALRISQDVESADLSGVAGTPTFFINGIRHHGAYDIDALKSAIAAERQRLLPVSPSQPA